MKKELEENFEKLKKLVDVVKGRKDVKSRVQVIADPDNLNTMSILTRPQAEFVAVANWACDSRRAWGKDLFRGLGDLAKNISETSISIGGEGREQAIRFMGALSETKLLSKLGVTMSGEQKEGKPKK